MRKNAMKKNVKAAAVVLLIGIIFAPISGFAWDKGWGKSGKWFGKGGHGRHFSVLKIWDNPEMVKKLGLTDEQIDKLKEADFDSRARALDLKGKMQEYKLEMDKLFAEETVNDAKVRQTAKNMSEIGGEMFMLRIEDRLAAKKILTAEQAQKLKSEFKERRQSRKGREGHGKRTEFGRFDRGDDM